MNKITKITLSSVVALGTLLGTGYTTGTLHSNQAHAAQSQVSYTKTAQPYYNFNGYATKSTPNFVLNQNFINALKYDNFKMNGVNIPYTTGKNALPNTIKNARKYDQEFAMVNSQGTSASYVTFNPNGRLTTNQIQNAYGNKLKLSVDNHKGIKVYVYNPYKEHYGIAFYTQNGKVQNIMIGHFLV